MTYLAEEGHREWCWGDDDDDDIDDDDNVVNKPFQGGARRGRLGG